MGYYKVYSKCVCTPKHIIEINQQTLEDGIDEAVLYMLDHMTYGEAYDIFDINVDDWCELDDATLNSLYYNIRKQLYEYFGKEEMFECGDYMIVKSDNENIEIPNVLGYTDLCDIY